MNAMLKGRIFTLLELVTAEADELNRLDGVAGDGDLGVTMGIAARAIIAELESAEPVDLSGTLQLLGRTMAKKAPSTGGTLLASALLRAAKAARPAASYAAVLSAATEAIMERGGAALGDKTMVDALSPAVSAASEAEARGASLSEVASSAAAAARQGAEKTALMRARHGRAGWLADRAEGSPDAGAWLISVILLALADGFDSGDKDSAQ